MSKRIVNFNYADFNAVKNIALSFPGAEESISHEGTPSVKVRGKLMCRLHESGEFIPIRLDFDIRETYLERYPEIFHLPAHFKGYPYICMWLHNYDQNVIGEVLEQSWKGLASKTMLKTHTESNK